MRLYTSIIPRVEKKVPHPAQVLYSMQLTYRGMLEAFPLRLGTRPGCWISPLDGIMVCLKMPRESMTK